MTATSSAAAAIAPPETAQVLDAWDETHALRAIRAALPPGHAASHRRPGQLVTMRVDGRDAYFALASAPSPDGVVDLLVKRGGAADAVLADARPGAPLPMSAPFGPGFPLDGARGRPLLLFAAGSGIAPMRALVQHVLRQRAEFDRVTLYYGQRAATEFAYAGEHAAWARGGVEVVLCASGGGPCAVARGRVHEVARAAGFGGARPDRAVAYVAGMRAMVDDVRATLAAAGVPPARVHLNF